MLKKVGDFRMHFFSPKRTQNTKIMEIRIHSKKEESKSDEARFLEENAADLQRRMHGSAERFQLTKQV